MIRFKEMDYLENEVFKPITGDEYFLIRRLLYWKWCAEDHLRKMATMNCASNYLTKDLSKRKPFVKREETTRIGNM